MRTLIALALVLDLLAPALAAPEGPGRVLSESWRLVDWLPGRDPELHRQLLETFHLDPGRLPRLEAGSDGVLVLANPGGAPGATAWAPLENLPPGVWTWRFQVRWTGEGEAPEASAVFLTESESFRPDRAWRSVALTAGVPGPMGPGAMALGLRARQGRLELRGSTRLRLPFDASAEVSGEGRLRLQVQGRPVEGMQVEVRSVPLDRWNAPDSGQRVVVPFVPEDGPGWVPGGNGAASRLLQAPPLPAPFLVAWRLLDRDGEILHAGGRLRVGDPPPRALRPGREVRVDENGILRVEGRPFLARGLYVHDASPAGLERVRELGLNLAVVGESEDPAALVRRGRELGLEVILESSVAAEPGRVEPETRALVDRLGRLPVLAWTAVDEPDLKPAWGPSLASLYRAFAEADSRPVYQANRTPASFPWAAPATDVLAVDPYPLAVVPRPLSTVGRWIDLARQAAPPGRSIWYVNQAFRMAPFWNQAPTPDQLRAMTWIALGHGARGIVYYAGHDILDPEAPDHRWDLGRSPLFEEIRREAAEVEALEPWLAAPEGPERPAGSGPLECAVWKGPRGGLVAIANPTGEPLAGVVSLGPDAREAHPWPAGPPVKLDRGAMLLRLPAFGVALFLLDPPPSGVLR